MNVDETQSDLRANLRALPRGAWILFAGTFLNKFGSFVLPFLTIYVVRMGFRPEQAALAVGAYGTGTLGACLIGGWLADRFGRRRTIILSMCSGAAVMLCLSQARGLPAIVLLAGLAGLAGELYRPASSALLADLVPTGQRVTAYAAYRAAFNAGWAFGPATAGWLAEKSFLWLFVGDAVTSILYAVVAWVWLPSGLRKESASNALADTVRVLRQDARFRQLLFASLLVGLVFVQLFSTMSLAVTQRGFSAATYGLIISLNGALVVLFELPLTSLTKRLPARKVMAFGYALIGIGFAFTGVASTLPLLILAMVLLTFGEMASMPIAGAYVADLAPTDNRGLYMGTYGLVWAVATVCGPGLGLVLFSANPTVLWVLCGVLGALAAGIMLAGSPGSVFGWRGPGLSAVRRVRE